MWGTYRHAAVVGTMPFVISSAVQTQVTAVADTITPDTHTASSICTVPRGDVAPPPEHRISSTRSAAMIQGKGDAVRRPRKRIRALSPPMRFDTRARCHEVSRQRRCFLTRATTSRLWLTNEQQLHLAAFQSWHRGVGGPCGSRQPGNRYPAPQFIREACSNPAVEGGRSRSGRNSRVHGCRRRP
jgi:hypothetical protein